MNEPTTPSLWNSIGQAMPSIPEEYEIEVAKQLEKLFQEFNIPPGSKLLEIAGGTGYLSAYLASKGYATTVSDFSEDMLKKAKEYYKKNNLDGNFLTLDMFKMSKEKIGSYDVVWIMRVFDHYDGWEVLQVLENMVKISQKLVIVIYQNTKCDPYLIYHKTFMEKGEWQFGLSILRDEFSDLATLAGLDIIDDIPATSKSELKNYVNLCSQVGGPYSDSDKKKITSEIETPLKFLIGRPRKKELDHQEKTRLTKKILKDELNYLRRTYHFDIQAFERRVAKLEEQIKTGIMPQKNSEKESLTEFYKLQLVEKEEEISNLQESIANYQNTITDIHQSFVLRMLHKYDKTIGKIIPLKPKKYTELKKNNLQKTST